MIKDGKPRRQDYDSEIAYQKAATSYEVVLKGTGSDYHEGAKGLGMAP
jgi:hypothetical protein